MPEERTPYQSGFEDAYDRAYSRTAGIRPEDWPDYVRGYRDGERDLARVAKAKTRMRILEDPEVDTTTPADREKLYAELARVTAELTSLKRASLVLARCVAVEQDTAIGYDEPLRAQVIAAHHAVLADPDAVTLVHQVK
jgi:hypothetical protein